MKAAEWIDRVKAAKGLPSDYAAAKALGVSRQAVSDYRNKMGTMDEEMSIKVAEAIGERPEFVLIDQLAERAKSDVARTAYRGILGRLGGVAASVSLTACVLVVGVSSPSPAQAQTHVDASSPLYIMLNRIVARLFSLLVARKRPQSSAGLCLC